MNIVTGLIVIFFGLNFLGVFRLNLFQGGAVFRRRAGLLLRAGVRHGVLHRLDPCVGAFLGRR